jgi:hypothetical protein
MSVKDLVSQNVNRVKLTRREYSTKNLASVTVLVILRKQAMIYVRVKIYVCIYFRL